MEIQIAEKASPCFQKEPKFKSEGNICILSKETLNKIEYLSHKNNLTFFAVLASVFAALIYRYLNEDNYKLKFQIRGEYSGSNTATDLQLDFNQNTTTYDIIRQIAGTADSFPFLKIKNNYSVSLDSFTCTYAFDPQNDSFLSVIFNSSINNEIGFCGQISGKPFEHLRWHEHFQVLLDNMCSKPMVKIAHCGFISNKELDQINEWSISSINPEFSYPSCLHHLFENTVKSYGASPALRCNGAELTYNEFNYKSNALARLLRSYGIGTGSYVAILLPRSIDVFIAIMGVLKTGAAYVPIDPRSPADRTTFILEDANVKLVLTDSVLKKLNTLKCDCICMENFSELVSEFSTENFSEKESLCTPDNPAYVIYTSGTTGKPKGVILLHKTVCNLIRGENYLYKVSHKDRIFQGFSVSFDASVEEMWLAWYSGALLVAATKSEALSGPDLVTFLQKEKITVFSTVPTQISMMQTPVESVRVLILGGEECHLKAIDPWLDSTRSVFNTYGPTEATVITTCYECRPGIPPSIGRPAPNYAVFILDRNLKPVPVGMAGELCIGGLCLASGYLNRNGLTETKFVKPPFLIGNNFPQRIYRSGDRARFDFDGNILFSGRIDDQVKLRGQRIELGEIEAALTGSYCIRQAAASLCTDSNGIQSLTAYMIPEDGNKFDEKDLRQSLKTFLPSYMIPSHFFTVTELPTLPSGKIDRKRLSLLNSTKMIPDRKIIAPRNDYENKIHNAWVKYLDRNDICITDDFFDIGGHSLATATIVSELRNQPEMKDLPLQYIYQYRTIEALASVLSKTISEDKIPKSSYSDTKQKKSFLRSIKFLICSFFQAVALYPIYLLFSVPLLIPFIVDWFNPGIEVKAWAVVTFLSMLSLMPIIFIISIITKWIAIGKCKPGVYSLNSFFYIRFWFVCRIMDLVPTRILRGTPFLTWYYRLLGAKIGKNVHISTDRLRVCDMVSIGNFSSINADTHIMAYMISKGKLHIGPIKIGNFCTIGTRSVLCENTVMKDRSELGELSLLPSDTVVGTGQYWEGAPASRIKNVIIPKKDTDHTEIPHPTLLYKVFFVLALVFVMIIPSCLLIPWVIAAFELYVNFGLLYTLPSTILMAATFTISFCFTVAVIRRIISPSTAKNRYDLYSIEYIRKWIVDTLVQMSLVTIQPIYATVYLPHWLRLLGAKIGKGAEISTVDHITADLLSIDEGSFIADSASVGPAVIRNGVMYITSTAIGKRSFIGNSALIPTGTHIGENCLIGVLSKPPRECSDRIINDTNWLGSPPIKLPKRQESRYFESKHTFTPPWYMVALRGFIEFFKITMPPALTSCCFIFSYWFMSEILGPIASLYAYILLCPVVIFACSITVSLLTVVLKWALVGRYREKQKPLWNFFIWKSEFINSLCENLVFPLLLKMIQGTPFLPAFFRLLGCKIGKNVFMETTEITEFDLVQIEDNASLNYGCTIQTHLFEDRVMKMSGLHIGENATVGPMSVILYNSSLKNGAVLNGLSLLMKGEILPSETKWFGIPARSEKTST